MGGAFLYVLSLNPIERLVPSGGGRSAEDSKAPEVTDYHWLGAARQRFSSHGARLRCRKSRATWQSGNLHEVLKKEKSW